MHLLLRRSQRDDSLFQGLLGEAITFMLDARLELTTEECRLAERYRLFDALVYDSEDRTYHEETAAEHFEVAAAGPLRIDSLPNAAADLATSLWNNAAGLWHGLMMALSLRITVGDLVDGQHIETDDLNAILICEKTIHQAAILFAAYLDTSLTFDGREDLHEI
jgi:hypothetical protein